MSKPVRNFGSRIGNHLGKPIYETIEDSNQRFIFVRIATGDQEGYPLDQLKSNEVLFRPGLIYRKMTLK